MRKSMANAQICRHRNIIHPMSVRSLTAEAPRELVVDRFDTPVGAMYAVADEAARLRAFAWVDREALGIQQLRQQYGARIPLNDGRAPASIRDALDRYFNGDLGALDEIPCATNGTPFQQDVWSTLRMIPVGATWSYGALAVRIGKANAVRAVGLANGANPIALVLPCHRVIGTDGSLTGYGGGLDRKRWLLAHEGAKGVFGNAPASLF
jgi:methylated-DNA-[protein]-cysteine S-methyltransferase